MKILTIDTSSEVCSVALLEDDKLIDKNELDNGKTHSETLMVLIDELLKRNNVDIKDINLFGCDVGPGSFTGIRIGVSTIKAMAEVLNVKIASVTSLEVLARNVQDRKIIASIIDARNDQVYLGIFDENYKKMEDYLADDIHVAIEHLKKYENVTFVGNGAINFKELIKENVKGAEFIENNKQSAEMLGYLTYKKHLENDLEDADTIIPIYLRKSQAERLKK